VPPPAAVSDLARAGHLAGEALAGLSNLLAELAPAFLLCDPTDVGGAVDAGQTGRDALFLYDRFPGGMGYARAAVDRLPELLAAARAVVTSCACEDGCPSCVGARETPGGDGDLSARGRLPGKAATAALLAALAPASPAAAAGGRRVPAGTSHGVKMPALPAGS
jgi:DEAD/DEAH box helicase domain-containing protein